MLKFTELQNIQKELDNYIGRKKNIEMGYFVKDRNIALIIEFNEFLNEVPELFKYWSDKKMDRSSALEEYVDVLHFMISISNDLNVKNYEYTEPKGMDMLEFIIGINRKMSNILVTRDFKDLMDDFLCLGYTLGFKEDEIFKEYLKKNEINYERQDNGY